MNMKIKYLLFNTFIFCSLFSLQAQTKVSSFVSKAGDLVSQFTREGADSVVELKLTGKINAIDFTSARRI